MRRRSEVVALAATSLAEAEAGAAVASFSESDGGGRGRLPRASRGRAKSVRENYGRAIAAADLTPSHIHSLTRSDHCHGCCFGLVTRTSVILLSQILQQVMSSHESPRTCPPCQSRVLNPWKWRVTKKETTWRTHAFCSALRVMMRLIRAEGSGMGSGGRQITFFEGYLL